MDFGFSLDQQSFRARARSWIGANMDERFRAAGLGQLFHGEDVEAQREWARRVYRAGYSGISWPREYGGQGLTAVERLIWNEELGRAVAPEGVNVAGTDLAGPLLLELGTEEQKQLYIPSIISAEHVWCQGFSEPESGSDLASLRTKAVRDGDDWIITGEKIWTSYAHVANWCLLLARTDRNAPAYRGITAFILPMTASGLSIRPLRQMTQREEFNSLFLDAVRVPGRNVIGEVNGGWRASTETLATERALTRLYRQARFLSELKAIADHLQRRTQDLPSAQVGYFSRKLTEHFSDLYILRLHNIKVAKMVAAGAQIGVESSLMKLHWSEVHQDIAELAIEILGKDAVAALDDGGMGRRFLNVYLQSRAETIYAGTSQIQRNIIAERLLGLPREQHAQKVAQP